MPSFAERAAALQASMDECFNKIQAMKDVADDESRDLSDQEMELIDSLAVKIENGQKRMPELNRLIEIENSSVSQGRKVVGVAGGPKPQPAFESFGSFIQNVCQSGINGTLTPQMRNYITNSGQSTTYTGGEGGFLLPPEFIETIYTAVTGSQNLASRCRTYNTMRNAIEWPVYEATPWGTSGVQVYWEGEGKTASYSGAPLDPRVLRVNKMLAFIPMTNESLDDIPFLTSFVQNELSKAINETITQVVYRGNGVKQPLGILNSPALITVAKEASQAADTIVINNILRMYQRISASSLSNCIVLHNQDILFQLFSMALPTGSSTAGMVYMPPGGVSGQPYSTLMGLPMVATQSASTLGDLGDIVFADLSEYMLLTKASGPKIDLDMSFLFDTDRSLLRMTYRIGGISLLSAPISPRYGTNTVGPFIALAERA